MRKIIVACGLLVVAGGVVLDRVSGDRLGPAVTGGVWPHLALLVLAAGGITALAATAPTARMTGLLAAVVGAGGLAVVIAGAVASGEPGPATGLLAVGAVAVVVGAATPLRVSNRWGAAAAAVLVAAAAAGAAVGVDRLPVRSRTAPAAAAAADPVLRPGPPLWRWTAPGGVDDVVPTASGIAVRSGDTVSGVDGATGATRWTYRRAGSPVVSLTVSPDGRSVVAAHAVDDDRFRPQRLAVLDAGTGAMRWDDVVGAWPDPGPFQLTDRVLTVLEEVPGDDRDDRAYRVVARSLADGARVWERVPPSGCLLGADGLVDRAVRNPEPLRARTTVVTWQDCGDERTGLGLDDRDGTERWTLPPVAVVVDGRRGREFFPVSLPDAGRVAFVRGGGDSLLVDPGDGRVVATLPQVDEVALLRSRPGATWALLGADGGADPGAALDPATGAVVPVDPGCTAGQDDIRVAVIAGATLRLCGAGPGFGPAFDGGPVVPVDLGPPSLDRIESDLESYRGPGPYLVVPAPGALVVGATSTDPAVLVGLGPAGTP